MALESNMAAASVTQIAVHTCVYVHVLASLSRPTEDPGWDSSLELGALLHSYYMKRWVT